jgi:multidrug efflux pump subunit AcrA (membrane-fusion protein)
MKLNLNKTQYDHCSRCTFRCSSQRSPHPSARNAGPSFLLHPAATTANQAPITKSVVAGPGLVEPNSENVQVGSELAGKLKQVLAEEGDVVKKGQVLAILVNDDYHAQVESKPRQVHQAEAAYEKNQQRIARTGAW